MATSLSLAGAESSRARPHAQGCCRHSRCCCACGCHHCHCHSLSHCHCHSHHKQCCNRHCFHRRDEGEFAHDERRDYANRTSAPTSEKQPPAEATSASNRRGHLCGSELAPMARDVAKRDLQIRLGERVAKLAVRFDEQPSRRATRVHGGSQANRSSRSDISGAREFGRENEANFVQKQRQNEQDEKKRGGMRDIITRVDYEPSSESSAPETDDDDDDDGGGAEEESAQVCHEACQLNLDSLSEQSGDTWQHEPERRQESPIKTQDALERIRSRGAIQVLPGDSLAALRRRRKLERKLTATRWQPPTDWRKYERRALSQLPCPYGGAPTDFVTNNCAISRSCEPTSVASKSGNKRLSSGKENNREEQQQKQKQQQQQQQQKQNICLASSGSPGTRGPPIVKHSTSSSRRLLRQLARLRRLEEPQYRVKRQASVAKIERLIEQLERATNEWSEDEHLLDRAERRDLSAALYERLANGDRDTPQRGAPSLADRLDFGTRTEVGQVEAESVARSHSAISLSSRHSVFSRQSSQIGAMSANSREPTLHRHSDDLAVRRLSRSPSVSSVGAQQVAQMSYLLCSSAYTPPIVGSGNKWSRYSRDDHLHVRSLDRRSSNRGATSRHPETVGAQLHDSGIARNERSRRDFARHKQLDRPNPFNVPAAQQGQQKEKWRSPLSDVDPCLSQAARSDSRVSFNVEETRSDTRPHSAGPLGRSSADSGFGQGGHTPAASSTTTISTIEGPIFKRTSAEDSPSTSNKRVELDEQIAFVETDLDEVPVADWCWVVQTGERTTTPPLESHQAAYGAAPTRLRPRINIESPRCKSPLLRASNAARTTSNGDCGRQRFVESNLDVETRATEPNVLVQTYFDSMKRRQELECSYNFADEDADQDSEQEQLGRFTRQPSRQIITTPRSEDTDEDVSEQSGAEQKQKQQQAQKTQWPKFSIGEYKSLNRPGLKIL